MKGYLSAKKVIRDAQQKLFTAAPKVAETHTVCVKKAPLSREYIFYWGKTK